MGRKKRKIEKPWCWYCNREFDDDKILIQHQKAKHFKCHICHKKLFSGPGLSIHCMQVHKETIDKIPGALPNRDNVQMEIYGMQGIPYGATRGVSAPDDESKRARVDDMAGMMPPFPPFPMPGGMPPLPGGMPPMPPGPPQGFMPPMPPMPFPGGGPMPPSLPQMPPGGPPQRHSQFFPAPPRSQGNFNDGYNYEANGDYPPEPRQQRRSRFDQGPPTDIHGNSRTPPSRDSYYAQGHEAGYRDDFRPPRGEPYPQSGGGYDNNGYPKEEPYYPSDAKYVPPVAAAAPPVVAPASKLGAKTKIVHPDDYTISLEERRALEELRYR